MNKRRIALLAGLMTLGMVSFAMDENPEMLKKEVKPLSIFSINDRVRFDENRLEVKTNFHFNENNRLEARIRNYSNVGSGDLGDTRESGNTAEDRTEMRLRLHTQTSVDNMEVRTELKTNTYGSGKGGNKQYFRVQPTWHLFTDVEGLSSLVRAGLAFQHYSPDEASTKNAYSISTSFENSYTINDYLEIEGNIYYDYTLGGKNTQDYNNVKIEAYAYANYPLYSANDVKVEALFEGGFDPYSFGARNFNDLNDVTGKDVDGKESYVIYAEPSVKATKTLSDRNSLYLQAGYYVEQNDDNSTGKVDDTAFVRVGFKSKF
ncbi:hypothetical protein NRK67_14235 [Fusobacteria bacterium ZRK30]|nr:hypothetical protein NRK67_14235 [Fusobacteria bacterium ZRK30]